MFGFIYSIAVSFASGGLYVISYFNKKIRFFLASRKNGNIPEPIAKQYWIHCASLGEFEMAVPIIERILITHRLDSLLITFFSPSGYTQAIKGKYKTVIQYLPMDTQKNVRLFYDTFKPKNALFIRYDFWYNYLKIGAEYGINFYAINGRFTANHFIFKTLGSPYKKLLMQFNTIFTSDKASAQLLKQHHFANAKYTGDTRYDRVAEIVKNAEELTAIQQFKGNRKLLVLGSSWQVEEEITVGLAAKYRSELAILIAPHDIKRSEEIEQKFSEYNAVKYSNLDKNTAHDILIIDNIGMLSRIYRYADFALVGGGFSGKLHNILEPAVWGCPLFFGPKIEKFAEAVDAVSAGFGFKIREAESLISQIEFFINNANELSEVKSKSKQFSSEQIGASGLIYDQIISNS